MTIGLCLAGGGAKGAFQAGVIKALYDRGINKFGAISGTSIGAINGYYVFTDNVDKLCEMWTNIQKSVENNIQIVDNTVDNSYAIDELKGLNDIKKQEIDFYVNYIEIKNNNVCEKVVNIYENSKEEALESIKYSALLPYNPNSKLPFKEQFKKDIYEGLYEGYKLDGGLVNNTLIKPLIEKNVDKIILISMIHDYILPEEIKNIYNVNNIIIVKPKTVFTSNDTLRFEHEFCKKIYNEGYHIGRNLKI